MRGVKFQETERVLRFEIDVGEFSGSAWSVDTSRVPPVCTALDSRLSELCERLNTWLSADPPSDTSEVVHRCSTAARSLVVGSKHTEAVSSVVRASLGNDLAAISSRLVHERRPCDPKDAALGALLGAVVGSAFGAPLEGLRRPATAAEIDNCRSMRGGGRNWLAPGQQSLAGEMTICVASALAHGRDVSAEIARRAESLGPSEARWSVGGGSGNGANARALSRATAIGVWVHRLTPERAAACAAQEAEVSNPREPSPSATAAYASAIAFLVARPQDIRRHEHAFETARFVSDSVRRSEALTAWLDSAASVAASSSDATAPSGAMFLMTFGQLGAAVCLSFSHLLRRTPFVQALEDVASTSMDAELNCAIVGGMLGALWGPWSIPQSWVTAVTNCSTELVGPVRPDWLHPRLVSSISASLIENSPEK